MKLAIVGDVEEGKEGAALRTIDTFVQDHKGGGGVMVIAGSLRLLSLAQKYAKDKGIPVVLLQWYLSLAVLNADKALLLHTPAYSVDEIVILCKELGKPYMNIK